MSRPRSKADFTAGVVVWDGEAQYRALELRVHSDSLYAMQPRKGKAVKSSYHTSGQFHFKIGNSLASTPTIELPPRFTKEEAFPLDHKRRCLFSTSLENAPTLLQYAGQLYDRRIDLRLPKLNGCLLLQLYLGSDSGQPLLFETEDYVEATITERSFSGADYDFCVRFAVISSEPVYRRVTDAEISRAWLEAGSDLGIRVIAPFPVRFSEKESILYEAHVLDFGGSKGMVVGVLDRDEICDVRRRNGYCGSDLAPVYRKYSRELFIETLNDWQWSGEKGGAPPWYTGKKWG